MAPFSFLLRKEMKADKHTKKVTQKNKDNQEVAQLRQQVQRLQVENEELKEEVAAACKEILQFRVHSGLSPMIVGYLPPIWYGFADGY